MNFSVFINFIEMDFYWFKIVEKERIHVNDTLKIEIEKTDNFNWLWGRGKDIKKSTDQIMKEIDEGEDVLIKAAEMKFKFLKERLSFIDCIGYILAKKHGALFLTGDERFRNKENVEFVK